MKKIKIKISAHYYQEQHLLKQNLQNSNNYKNCEFFINKDIEECDFWFIYDGFPKEEKAFCPEENVVLITGEPESVKTYHQKFLNQYGYVFTCQESIKHSNKIQKQLIPWYVEKSYLELMSIKPNKTKLLSVVCSSKSFTPGHQKRLQFLEVLKEHFGNKLDIFGRGIIEIPEKWDAITPYKYHLVLENSVEKNYWTEKLADSYLGEAYPFYSGCPNISEYFPKGCYTQIDLNDFTGSIKIIEDVIKDNVYENSQKQLLNAKDLILNKYNMLFVIAEFAIQNYKYNVKKQNVVLKSDPHFKRFENIWTEFKRKPFIYTFNQFKKIF